MSKSSKAPATKAKQNTGRATKKKKAISLATVLEHVQALRGEMKTGERRLTKQITKAERELMTHIADARSCLLGEIKNTEARLTARVDGIEKQVQGLETNLTRQITGIDERLDAMEMEKLPQRVAVLESALGVAGSGVNT